MSKSITIDNLTTILDIVGEEDTCLGFENDTEVQDALEVIQKKIEALLDAGDLSTADVLVSFI